MCFSATASFAVAGCTGVVGAFTLRRVRLRSELPLALVPAIFAVNADFSETLRNFRKEGEYFVIDGVAPQYTLRDGNEWTCIFNLRKPDFAAPDPAILGPVEDDMAKRRRRSGNG